MGILVNTGFDVGSSSPIDNRTLKETTLERDELVTDGLVYEGMKVYCKDTKLEYRYNGIYWDEVGSSGGAVIDDTVISTAKTHSSSKIHADIQQCLDDSKSYTLEELGKLNGASYKVVDSTSEMISESIIYLLHNATNYDMYIVESDGTVRKIGDTTINLDDYFTKQEIEADYLKKTDADSKYATITTVDVGKTLITFPDSTNHKVITSAETYYIVKNGICYIHLAFGCVLENATTTITGLPLPLANSVVYAPQAVPYDYNDLTSIRVRVLVNPYGILELIGGSAGIPYVCSFSYPVAES